MVVNTTRLYLSPMTAVLQQTSQDREFLNRLRAFGLDPLIDAYLTSIMTSDGAKIGGVSPLAAQHTLVFPKTGYSRASLKFKLLHYIRRFQLVSWVASLLSFLTPECSVLAAPLTTGSSQSANVNVQTPTHTSL